MSTNDLKESENVMQRHKLGIALGGGGARGWAHIGVLKALNEIGIQPDIIAGTSIGSIAGGCYAANELPELEVFATGLTKRRVLGFLDINMAGSSLISGRRICNALEAHLEGRRIEQLDRQFVAVATEIGTGHEVWMDRGYLVNAMRASYALPGIFKPVNINGRWLFDGAMVNPVPVSVCRALGASVVIAVNLNSDIFGKGTVIPSHEAIEIEALEHHPTEEEPRQTAFSRLRNHFFSDKSGSPGVSRVMLDAFNITQDRIARARLAGDPPDISIKPRLNGIGLFDFHRAEEMIQLGIEGTLRARDDLDHHLGLVAA